MTQQSDELAKYLQGKNEATIPLFLRFREAALRAGGGEVVEEKVSASMVAWRAKRNFATAYIKGRYLECSIDLLEQVGHEHLKSAFHTTKKILTHRFTIEPDEDIDADLVKWLKQAYETVGLGTRQQQLQHRYPES
ncbi:DUF5655 domain-containing protein (plasmid) [Devosia neptuniae]|uniref:DUF5655 domain-containing protein n=1 Tax=Devosia neptuniae TaxID=191302 RepID=A0ABY6C707_9HYPH|nr:DUF5655 domain-containing protein [Devosia neptuniae]UXN68032.1 DUF5655 domain-containing protein [Devosia neptuniae]